MNKTIHDMKSLIEGIEDSQLSKKSLKVAEEYNVVTVYPVTVEYKDDKVINNVIDSKMKIDSFVDMAAEKVDSHQSSIVVYGFVDKPDSNENSEIDAIKVSSDGVSMVKTSFSKVTGQ